MQLRRRKEGRRCSGDFSPWPYDDLTTCPPVHQTHQLPPWPLEGRTVEEKCNSLPCTNWKRAESELQNVRHTHPPAKIVPKEICSFCNSDRWVSGWYKLSVLLGFVVVNSSFSGDKNWGAMLKTIGCAGLQKDTQRVKYQQLKYVPICYMYFH